MDASQPQQPKRPAPVRANPETIESHLTEQTPMPAELAKAIWLFNAAAKHSPEITWPGEW